MSSKSAAVSFLLLWTSVLLRGAVSKRSDVGACMTLSDCALSKECVNLPGMISRVVQSGRITWSSIMSNTDINCVLDTCSPICEMCNDCRAISHTLESVVCRSTDFGPQSHCPILSTRQRLSVGCSPFNQCVTDCANTLQPPPRSLADMNLCLRQCMPQCIQNLCTECRGFMRWMFVGACRRLHLASIFQLKNCHQFWQLVLKRLDTGQL